MSNISKIVTDMMIGPMEVEPTHALSIGTMIFDLDDLEPS